MIWALNNLTIQNFPVMKNIYQVSILLLLHLAGHSQSPVSLVGSYQRDDPKYDQTNYEGENIPCFRENITSTVGFRGYDENQSLSQEIVCSGNTKPRFPWESGVWAF